MFQEDAWWVINSGNTQLIYYHNGNEVPNQIWARVTTFEGDLPKATFQCVVNIAESKEQMMKEISKRQKPLQQGKCGAMQYVPYE